MKTFILPFKLKKSILAFGADSKGAFSLAEGQNAILVDGFGDLSDIDNFAKYEKEIASSSRKFKIKPKIFACDLHPEYHSTRLAESYQPCKVQHHEAHIASAIVDNSIKGDVIGIAFDGTGFGSDGNIWGGEFFVGNLRNFKRVAHLEYIPMPGGEAAIKEPWRMAGSWLYRIFGNAKNVNNKKAWPILKKMIERKVNSPLTSSMGRLFDAAASLILSKDNAGEEAELPVELERIAVDSCNDFYNFEIRPKDGMLILDSSSVIKGIVKDLSKKIDISIISSKFHNTVANMILRVSLNLRKKFKVDKVVLSGGVFQNRYLTNRAIGMLEKDGLSAYVSSKIPVNDSAISIGQIAIAGARLRCA